jgi:hypothetical protein
MNRGRRAHLETSRMPPVYGLLQKDSVIVAFHDGARRKVHVNALDGVFVAVVFVDMSMRSDNQNVHFLFHTSHSTHHSLMADWMSRLRSLESLKISEKASPRPAPPMVIHSVTDDGICARCHFATLS